MGDDHIHTVVSHIISPYPIPIFRMTTSISHSPNRCRYSYRFSLTFDLPYRSPTSISHIDIGSYFDTLRYKPEKTDVPPQHRGQGESLVPPHTRGSVSLSDIPTLLTTLTPDFGNVACRCLTTIIAYTSAPRYHDKPMTVLVSVSHIPNNALHPPFQLNVWRLTPPIHVAIRKSRRDRVLSHPRS
jgi:hypothetical protein